MKVACSDPFSGVPTGAVERFGASKLGLGRLTPGAVSAGAGGALWGGLSAGGGQGCGLPPDTLPAGPLSVELPGIGQLAGLHLGGDLAMTLNEPVGDP